jgi:PAS domain S-box-containing protein
MMARAAERWMSPHLWRMAGAFVAFNAILLCYLLLKPGSFGVVTGVDNVAQFVGPLIALPLCWLPMGRQSSYARVRFFLGLGILSESVGQIIFTYYEQILMHPAPFPSWADAAYLTLYPSFFVAILLLTHPASGLSSARLALDGLAIMVAVFAFSWYFIVEPAYEQSTDSTFAKVVGATYPLCDVLLLACLLLLWSRLRDDALRPVFALLGLALAIIIVTDTIYDYQTLHGSYATGEPLDVGWPLGFMVVGLAAAALAVVRQPAAVASDPPSMMPDPPPSHAMPLWQSLLPYALIPVVALLGAYAWGDVGMDGETKGVFVCGAILVLAVLARQVLTVLDNNRLYGQLNEAFAAQGQGLARRVKELEWLRDVSRSLSAAATLEDVLNVAYDSVRGGLGFDRVGVNLFDYEKGIFEDVVGTDARGNKIWPKDRTIHLTSESQIWAFPGFAATLRGEDYYYTTRAYEECPPEMRYLYDGNPTHNLMVPLRADDRVMGCISVDNLATARPIARDDVGPLIALANQVGLAVERKRTEAALHASEERLRAVMSKAPIVLFNLDRDGTCTLATGGEFRLLGLQPDELVGQSIFDLYADREDLLDSFRRAVRGEIHTSITEIYDRALETYWMPQCTDDGVVYSVIGVVLDVTERARAQDEAERARAAAEDLARLRSDFVASVSHELRTPLTAIVGYAELLQARWSQLADGERLERLGRIVSSANRQQRLVEDLLLLSRLEVGALVPHIEPFALKDLIERAADDVRSSYRGQPIEVDGIGGARVLVDSDRALQILTNLIDNAAKYSSEGATISVCWECDATDAVIHVRDRGSGMSLEGREYLFTRFGRVPGSRTRAGRVGTGLGLYLGRSLAQAMGGTLELQSSGPEGSTFTLRLPLAMDAQ